MMRCTIKADKSSVYVLLTTAPTRCCVICSRHPAAMNDQSSQERGVSRAFTSKIDRHLKLINERQLVDISWSSFRHDGLSNTKSTTDLFNYFFVTRTGHNCRSTLTNNKKMDFM